MRKKAETMNNTLYTASDLRNISFLSKRELNTIDRVIQRYPMRIPASYYSLIDPSDSADPIARMCIPSADELDPSGSFDTSGEKENTAQIGIQHKYRQTALILTTNACAMYCRHCFRKRLVGISDAEMNRQADEAVNYIRNHPEINNVLLSGGDALMLPNSILQRYLSELCTIESLDFIRIGSRTPVVFPQRILMDDELIEILRECSNKKATYLITQFNHSKEIASEQMEAIKRLHQCVDGIRNQAVLLRGVNDNKETLGALLQGLTRIGIAPYYVFQCRPVRGVKRRFQVPLLEGAELIDEAKSLQNGLGKSFRYVLSHPRGKIEILGLVKKDRLLFKFHQSKNASDKGRLFTVHLSLNDTWLDDDLKGT